MYYIRVENGNFGFVTEYIHEILEIDIEVSNEDYNKFFELQTQGKQFRVKNQQATTLFEILEEYIPDQVGLPQEPSTSERLVILEQENADLLLDSVKKDMRIEQNELDIADLLLVIGGM